MPRTTTTKVYTALDLAKELKIDFVGLQALASEIGVTITSPSEAIEPEVKQTFLDLSNPKAARIITPPPPEEIEPVAEPIKAQDLANKLGIAFPDLQQLLVPQNIDCHSPTTLIDVAIANGLLFASQQINSKHQLKGGSTEVPPQEGEQPQQQKEEVSLSLTDVKTIAAAANVTQRTVINLQQAIRNKRQEINLQQGYYDTKADLAVYQTGSTLAYMEFYGQTMQELREKEKQLNSQEFDLVAIADNFGINISGILQNLQTEDEEYLKNKVAAEDKAQDVYDSGEELGMVGSEEQGKEIVSADSFKLMQLKLADLGKSLT